MQLDLLQLDMEDASTYFVRHPKESMHELSGKELLHEAMKFKVTRRLLSEIERTRKFESLQYRLTRTSFSDTDAMYYPELDNRPEDTPSDLDPIRCKLATFDSTVAQDVQAFRDKIEKLEKALEKSSQTLVNATKAAMDASYQLEELMEWHERLTEQIHQLYQCEAARLLPAASQTIWYYRVFGCFDHQHSMLHDADEGEAKFDRFYYHKKLAQVTRNLANAQSNYKECTRTLWDAQVDMEERHYYKKKLIEQFWTMLQQTQAAKGQMLLGLFQQLDRNTT
ncbi:hypothetical protein THRCLA_07327 [Thraustotheca clavata]|uniref:Uncharacterized protein n=1 Tax=Thraustotheca clavata TaxID=74557 RepID=A0A1V9ZEJ1_9STRA|nr:hypothetical protein THRCLA_07327 [Thraustotheca clavata]